ncbi:MAG: XRE family transcriptional regulator [Dehalococcoidia bacterium]|nr:XRE family transcriptional regulator [Dehalococcoidia bacterium]
MVTPNLLSWARHRRGMNLSDLAFTLKVKPELVAAWETGERRPTFRQAQNFAKALYVPFGYLYLLEPPVEELPIADFRTIPGQAPPRPSPDLLDLLNDVIGKQQWYREYRESEGVEELPFIGRFTASDSEETVASDVRDVIGVDRARQQSSNWESFMRTLTRNAEDLGIMVMRSGIVGSNTRRALDVKEFRGFSVSDHIAPLIFINGRDFKGAQLFTLAHEMAHIWIGEGGISNPDYGLDSEYQDGAVELFCNRIAAETLVPSEDFQSRWSSDDVSLSNNLNKLSGHYKVSSMVILRQAHDCNLVTDFEYRESYSQLAAQASQSTLSSKPGGNPYHNLTARNGTAFTKAVVASAEDGTLMSSEAADMLGVKVKTLPKVASRLFGSSLNLG